MLQSEGRRYRIQMSDGSQRLLHRWQAVKPQWLLPNERQHMIRLELPTEQAHYVHVEQGGKLRWLTSRRAEEGMELFYALP